MIGSTTVMAHWPIMTFLFVWILLGNLDLIISVSMMFQRTRNISTSIKINREIYFHKIKYLSSQLEFCLEIQSEKQNSPGLRL